MRASNNLFYWAGKGQANVSALRVMKQYNVVMRTKKDYAGDGQEQFT
jgi:hypothetical protein